MNIYVNIENDNIIDKRGRMYYWQFLNKSEATQYNLGIAINDLTRGCNTDKRRYKDSIELYLNSKHLINDPEQTSITKNMISCLLESNYITKLCILKTDRIEELCILRDKKLTPRCLKKEKTKIIKKLNKIIPNLKSNMITIEKKRFLTNIEPANLPHDLENLIFTYLY